MRPGMQGKDCPEPSKVNYSIIPKEVIKLSL